MVPALPLKYLNCNRLQKTRIFMISDCSHIHKLTLSQCLIVCFNILSLLYLCYIDLFVLKNRNTYTLFPSHEEHEPALWIEI